MSLSDALARARSARGQVTVTATQVAEARAALRSAGATTNATVSYTHTGATPEEHLLGDQSLGNLLRQSPEGSGAETRLFGAQVDSGRTMPELVTTCASKCRHQRVQPAGAA